MGVHLVEEWRRGPSAASTNTLIRRSGWFFGTRLSGEIRQNRSVWDPRLHAFQSDDPTPNPLHHRRRVFNELLAHTGKMSAELAISPFLEG